MIFALADYCAANSDMGVIVGTSGVGKTTALKEYVRRHAGTVLCEMVAAKAAMSAALGRVCEAMGALGARRSADSHEIICNQLRYRDIRLLIIDEAQHLNDLVLDELRGIHDEEGVGLVFCGNPDFRSRYNNRRVAAFAQFRSRVGMCLPFLSDADPADVAAICQHHGVTNSAARIFLVKQTSKGGLRRVEKLLRPAVNAAGSGPAVREQHLRDALVGLGLDNE